MPSTGSLASSADLCFLAGVNLNFVSKGPFALNVGESSLIISIEACDVRYVNTRSRPAFITTPADDHVLKTSVNRL